MKNVWPKLTGFPAKHVPFLTHDPYTYLSQQMQLVCSAETKADELFLSGKLSESDALQARVLMGDLDIDVVRISYANDNDIVHAHIDCL